MNQIKTVFLLTLLTGLMLIVGKLFGGNDGMFIMLIFSIAINLFSYWKSDTLFLKMYSAKRVDDNHPVYSLVENLAKNANIPMPKIYIMETQVQNAFATGRNPSHASIALTTGILNSLTTDELEGVIAHELSHVIHRDTLISTIVASIAGVIIMIANIAKWTAIFRGGSNDNKSGGLLELLLLVIVAPIAASLIQLSISRSREYFADELGAKISKKPLALASALAKIEKSAQNAVLPNASDNTAHMFIINPLIGAKDLFKNLFSTHPNTESRIKRLIELEKEIN